MSVEEASQRREESSGSNQEVPIDNTEKQTALDQEDQSQEKEGESSIDNQLKGLSIEDNTEVRAPPKLSREERHAVQIEADSRSIFVGNIAADVTPEIIEEHFAECGEIKRITLLHDKHTGVPKGYAYVQFELPEVQEKALKLDGTELKGNKINVYKKRTNLPGYHKYYQYQRPLYYPNQWGYAYGGLPDFKAMNFFPPYPFHPNQQRYFGRFNHSHRGKKRNNYRGGRRSNGRNQFHKYGGPLPQSDQSQASDQQSTPQDGDAFSPSGKSSDKESEENH